MSSPSNKPANAPKEMSSEIRMLLFFALAGLILFGSNWLYHQMGWVPQETSQTAPKAAGGSGAKTSTVAHAATGSTTSAPVSKSAPAAPPQSAPAAPVAPIAVVQKQTTVVDTDVYHIVFSNEGAVVHNWTLKKYKDAKGHPLELVNQAGA